MTYNLARTNTRMIRIVMPVDTAHMVEDAIDETIEQPLHVSGLVAFEARALARIRCLLGSVLVTNRNTNAEVTIFVGLDTADTARDALKRIAGCHFTLNDFAETLDFHLQKNEDHQS